MNCLPPLSLPPLVRAPLPEPLAREECEDSDVPRASVKKARRGRVSGSKNYTSTEALSKLHSMGLINLKK